MERDLEKIFERLNINNEWESRISALQDLSSLAEHGVQRPAEFSQQLKSVIGQLDTQLTDRRSAVVKEVCHLLSNLGEKLELYFENYAESLLPALLKLVVVTVLIIAESADTCIKTLLRNCRVVRMLPRFINYALHDKSPIIRSRCSEYALLVLQEWGMTPEVQRFSELFQEMVRGCVKDAIAEVRSTGRRCFLAFKDAWPPKSGRLLASLDPHTQKLINDDSSSDARLHFRRSIASSRQSPTLVEASRPISGLPVLRAVRTAGVLQAGGSRVQELFTPLRDDSAKTLKFPATSEVQGSEWMTEMAKIRSSATGAVRVQIPAATRGNFAQNSAEKVSFGAENNFPAGRATENTAGARRVTEQWPGVRTQGQQTQPGQISCQLAVKPTNHRLGGPQRVPVTSKRAEPPTQRPHAPISTHPERNHILGSVQEASGPVAEVMPQGAPERVEPSSHRPPVTHSVHEEGEQLPGNVESFQEASRPPAVSRGVSGGLDYRAAPKRSFLKKRSSLAGTYSSMGKAGSPSDVVEVGNGMKRKARRSAMAAVGSGALTGMALAEVKGLDLLEKLTAGMGEDMAWDQKVSALEEFQRELEEGRDSWLLPEGLAQNVGPVLRMLAAGSENLHVKVVAASLSAIRCTVKVCRHLVAPHLEQWLPFVLARLVDMREQIRAMAAEIVDAVRDLVQTAGILPYVLRAIDSHKGPKSRLKLVQFVNSSFLLESHQIRSQVMSPAAPGPTLKMWVGKLGNLWRDPNSAVKQVAIEGLCVVSCHVDAAMIRAYIASKSPQEQRDICKAMKRHDATFDDSLTSYLQQGRNSQEGSSPDKQTSPLNMLDSTSPPEEPSAHTPEDPPEAPPEDSPESLTKNQPERLPEGQHEVPLVSQQVVDSLPGGSGGLYIDLNDFLAPAVAFPGQEGAPAVGCAAGDWREDTPLKQITNREGPLEDGLSRNWNCVPVDLLTGSPFVADASLFRPYSLNLTATPFGATKALREGTLPWRKTEHQGAAELDGFDHGEMENVVGQGGVVAAGGAGSHGLAAAGLTGAEGGSGSVGHVSHGSQHSFHSAMDDSEELHRGEGLDSDAVEAADSGTAPRGESGAAVAAFEVAGAVTGAGAWTETALEAEECLATIAGRAEPTGAEIEAETGAGEAAAAAEAAGVGTGRAEGSRGTEEEGSVSDRQLCRLLQFETMDSSISGESTAKPSTCDSASTSCHSTPGKSPIFRHYNEIARIVAEACCDESDGRQGDSDSCQQGGRLSFDSWKHEKWTNSERQVKVESTGMIARVDQPLTASWGHRRFSGQGEGLLKTLLDLTTADCDSVCLTALELIPEIVGALRERMQQDSVGHLLSQLISCLGHSDLSICVAAEECIDAAITHLPPSTCLSALCGLLHNDNLKVLALTIGCVKQVMSAMGPDLLMQMLPLALPGIMAAFNSHSSDVRKSAVTVLVDMYMILGAPFVPHLSLLSEAQLKMLTLYANRISKSHRRL